VKFINERGGHAVIPHCHSPEPTSRASWTSSRALLFQETKVTQEINAVVDTCLKEKDYTTHNFMQWYVAEQIEEEALARTLIDKLNLIGNDKGGLYLFDRDLQGMSAAHAGGASQGGHRLDTPRASRHRSAAGPSRPALIRRSFRLVRP
jgi:ferritin